MRTTILLALASILLTGCSLPGTPELATTPPNTESSSAEPETTYPQACYFNWATQPLPELSSQVQSALEDAGLTGVAARAEAYGENCYDSQTNEVVYFAAMQTDFRVTINVPDLKDTERLGDLLEKVLIALDNFPTDKTPGPNPGYVGVTFQAGGEELNLWFTVSQGIQVRQQGLRGDALLKALLFR